MTSLIDALLGNIEADSAISPARRELLRDLLTRVVSVADSDASSRDLRVAVTAIDELLDAFTMFDKWHERPKLTIFGSARTRAGHPLYELTLELSRAMAERGWIIVSGAGPGIMEASAQGAGKENVLGVNIALPFEQHANGFIDVSTMLVTMKYFFTRKVALTRSSMAFVVLPGGLGTMDELFEILTLLDTGKTAPAPVVLLDNPEGSFWQKWMTFVDEAIVTNSYVDTDDLCLVRAATSVSEAIDEIEHFYSNFVAFSLDGPRGIIALKHDANELRLGRLRQSVPAFDGGGGYMLNDPRTISFDFDGRNYMALRLVIDEVNSWID